MIGLSRVTGLAIDGSDHLRQSLHDIASTLIGTRLCRRDYGSLVPELIDQPVNAATTMRLMSALTTAYVLWEPRVRIQKITLHATDQPQQWIAQIEALRLDTPKPDALNLPLLLGAST
jgi:phage baseplate assembly protein W